MTARGPARDGAAHPPAAGVNVHAVDSMIMQEWQR